MTAFRETNNVRVIDIVQVFILHRNVRGFSVCAIKKQSFLYLPPSRPLISSFLRPPCDQGGRRNGEGER